MKQRSLIVSYAVPLAWLAWKLLKDILSHMLTLLITFILCIPIFWFVSWLQDLNNPNL